MLRFRDTGVAFAHFSLPHHRVPWREVASEVDRAIESAQLEVESRTLEYTVGPTDLVVRLNIKNFRPLSLLQGQILSTWAERSTWVFAVPFVEQCEGYRVAPGPGDISYLLHVRVRRDIYREGGVKVDEAIVDAAHEFAEQAGLSLEVLAGLGWSDLILAGGFSCDIETFLAFVLKIQALEVADHSIPVIDRVLTVLSFSMELADSPERTHPAVKPLTYVRADAGRFVEAADFFSSPAEAGGTPMLFALEGKWDLVVLPSTGSVTNLPSHLIEFLRNSPSVQRIETHVLALDPAAAMEALRGDTPIRLQISPPNPTGDGGRCGCSLDSLPMDALKLLNEMDRSIVPRRLKATLENVLMLLRYALRDQMNCCDTYPGVRACVASFASLLEEMKLHGESLKALNAQHDTILTEFNKHGGSDQNQEQVSNFLKVNEGIGHLHDVLEQQRELLETWCQTSERALSERTAGSFEDLFGRTDRLSTYRGGLQKLLFLADCLLDEFCCLASLPFENSVPGKFALGTLCEPISTLRSMPTLGIVEIPARDRFSLALIAPQLWHEVGQYLFRRRYPMHTSPIIEERLQSQAREIEKIAAGRRREIGANSGLASISPSEGSQREFRQQILDQDFSLRDLGDIYADLIVFHYGLGEDWANFAAYLTDVVAEAARHEEMPTVVWWRQCTTLALRLFHVATFGCLRLKLKEKEFAGLAFAGEEEFRERLHQVMKDSSFVFALASDAVRTIEVVLQATHYEKLSRSLPPSLQATVNFNVANSTEVTYFRLEFIIDLLYYLRGREAPVLETAEEGLSLLERGDILDLGARVGEISALFHAQFISALSERRSGVKSKGASLSAQAALGRSATLAFMKRQNQTSASGD